MPLTWALAAMDARLRNLINQYLGAVSTAVSLLQKSGISLPATNAVWAATEFPESKKLQGEVPFFKHGYGCTVSLPEGVVDFDFGENGETDGFDLWRLQRFAECNMQRFEFKSLEDIAAAFENAKANQEFRYSGYLLYYLK